MEDSLFVKRYEYEDGDPTLIHNSAFSAETPDCEFKNLFLNPREFHSFIEARLRLFAKKGLLKKPFSSEYFNIDPTIKAPAWIRKMRKAASELLLQNYITREHREDLIKTVCDFLEENTEIKTVSLVRNIGLQENGISWNYLSDEYESWVLTMLKNQFPEINVGIKNIVRNNQINRFKANPIQRITRQPVLSSSESFDPGEEASIIIDEQVQSGDMVASLFHYLKNKNIKIIGIFSLAAHPDTLDLRPEESLVEAVYQNQTKEVFPKLKHMLDLLGLPIKTLSNRNLLTLLGEREETLNRLRNDVLKNVKKVIEGKEDNPDFFSNLKNDFINSIIDEELKWINDILTSHENEKSIR
jgi:hypothetical protein